MNDSGPRGCYDGSCNGIQGTQGQAARPSLQPSITPYRKPALPGRNDPCLCGSGKKAKKCCLDKLKALETLPTAARQQVLVQTILGHSL